MIDKKGLLKLAIKLSEFGDAGTIKKVVQVAQDVNKKDFDENGKKQEFMKMMGLYYYHTDIIGGGKTAKENLKRFISDWLKIRCLKGQSPAWNNSEIGSIDFNDFIYVLAWAGRVANEAGQNSKALIYDAREVRDGKNNVKENGSEKNGQNSDDATQMYMEEKLAMLMKKYGK